MSNKVEAWWNFSEEPYHLTEVSARYCEARSKSKNIWCFLRELWNSLLFPKYLEISSSLLVTFISPMCLPWPLSWENVEFTSLGISRNRLEQFLSNLIQLLWGGVGIKWPSEVPSKLNCSTVPWFNLPPRYTSQKEQVKGCWERQTCLGFFGGCFFLTVSTCLCFSSS